MKKKFKAELLQLDIARKYGYTYSREVLERAFADPVFVHMNENKQIPVKLECGDVVGYCSMKLEYPTMYFDGELDLEDGDLKCLGNELAAIAPAGFISFKDGEVDYVRYAHCYLIDGERQGIKCSMEVLSE